MNEFNHLYEMLNAAKIVTQSGEAMFCTDFTTVGEALSQIRVQVEVFDDSGASYLAWRRLSPVEQRATFEAMPRPPLTPVRSKQASSPATYYVSGGKPGVDLPHFMRPQGQ